MAKKGGSYEVDKTGKVIKDNTPSRQKPKAEKIEKSEKPKVSQPKVRDE